MVDLDAWLNDYKPYVSSAVVCGRADLISEHARLDLELVAAKDSAGNSLADPEVDELKSQIEAIEAQIEESQVEFTFQGVGIRAWQDLKRKYPPNETQRKAGLDANMERFTPAAIAASSLNPKISPEQAESMFSKLPAGEWDKLYYACRQANGEVIGSPKSAAAAFIEASRKNGDSSTISLPGTSPGPSPSDDGGGQ